MLLSELIVSEMSRDEVNAICGSACAGKISDYLAAREEFTPKMRTFMIFCQIFGYFFNFLNKYRVWEKNLAQNCNKIKLFDVLDGKFSNYSVKLLGKFQFGWNLLHPWKCQMKQVQLLPQ